MSSRAAGIAAALAAAFVATSCGSSPAPTVVPESPSPDAQVNALLVQTWQGYIQDFIQGDGRVIDHRRDEATTSEGQSYALLRAVWVNDRATFDRVWTWTRANLQVRGSDHLFAYLWGRHDTGWGVVSHDSATDADQDIALALVLASERWSEASYAEAARDVIADIWSVETVDIGGRHFVTAGNWAANATPMGPVINPSYLAPYAYRVFASVDRSHGWNTVVDTAYEALNLCTAGSLGGGPGVLPPNWCVIDHQGRSATSFSTMPRGDDFGYDAFRVMWRIALDYRWYRSTGAVNYIANHGFLVQQWRTAHSWATEYSHRGDTVVPADSVTTDAGDIGALIVADPVAAREALQSRLLTAARHDGGVAYWSDRGDYYQQNWAWFGVALASDALMAPGSPTH